MASSGTGYFGFESLAYYDDLVKSSSLVTNFTKNVTSFAVGNNLRVVPSDTSNEGRANNDVIICNMALLMPYSFRGDQIVEDDGFQDYEWTAAAAMAIQHLNRGDTTIVQELQGLPDRCPVRFTFDLYNTQYEERHSVDTVIGITDDPNGIPDRNGVYTKSGPCAFMGAGRTAVSMPTSIITGLRGYPQVSPSSSGASLDNPELYPLFGRTIPADDAVAVALVKHLREVLNVRHWGILYTNTNYGTSFFAGLQAAMQRLAPDMVLVGTEIPLYPSQQEVQRAVRVLKDSQYRYFYGIILGYDQFDAVMNEAYHEGVIGDNSDNTWFFGDTSYANILGRTFPADSILHRALQGSGIVAASGGLPGSGRMPGLDSYLGQIGRVPDSARDLDYLIRKTSAFSSGQVTTELIQSQYPTFNDVLYGPLVYDAIIGLGLSACNAALDHLVENYNPYFTGYSHFDHFKNVTFGGASGNVRFQEGTGMRDPESAYYILSNVLGSTLPEDNTAIQFSALSSAIFEDGSWNQLKPFYYSDGSTNAHSDLPVLVLEQNLLVPEWRAVGLAMCCVALAMSIGFASWIAIKRKSRVVTTSQPIFLYLICFGCFVFAASIIPLSIDEGVASAQGCTIACTSSVWSLSIGFCIVFSALFTKTLRINKLFSQASFRRIKVTALDVAKPMMAMLGANLLILSLMSGLSPVEWEVSVVETDKFGRIVETQGRCDWIGSIPYLAVLGSINFCCVAFVVVQAYRARHISLEYSESEYIFLCLLSILLAGFLSFPVLLLTKDNPVAFYFVLAATIMCTSCSVLLLIFAPKIRYERAKKKDGQDSRYNGTSFGGQTFITISGSPALISQIRKSVTSTRNMNGGAGVEILHQSHKGDKEELRKRLSIELSNVEEEDAKGTGNSNNGSD